VSHKPLGQSTEPENEVQERVFYNGYASMVSFICFSKHLGNKNFTIILFIKNKKWKTGRCSKARFPEAKNVRSYGGAFWGKMKKYAVGWG
jgi:hypothetical protein